MSLDPAETLRMVLHYAVHLGWLVCQVTSKKEPGLPDGRGGIRLATGGIVTNRTADPNEIARRHELAPTAGWAIATGAPGPDVIDIDDLAACPVYDRLCALETPQVQTGRDGGGRHVYVQGTNGRSPKLPWGEYKSHNGYVVAPPSLHQSGRQYVWVKERTLELVVCPEWAMEDATSDWRDLISEVDGKVPNGHRHIFVRQRLLSEVSTNGTLDQSSLRKVAVAAMGEHFEERIPAKEVERLAKFAVSSRIAADVRSNGANGRPRKTSKGEDLPPAPGTLELDQVLEQLDHLVFGSRQTERVVRYGRGDDDPLEWHLQDTVIYFPRQSLIASRQSFNRIIGSHTDGRWTPLLGNNAVLWVAGALFRLAGMTERETEEAEMVTLVREHVDQCGKPMRGTLEDVPGQPDARWDTIARLRALPRYNQKDHRDGSRPTALRDEQTGLLYVRASELLQTAARMGLGLNPHMLRGRMATIGVTWQRARPTRATDAGRQFQELRLYEIPATVAGVRSAVEGV